MANGRKKTRVLSTDKTIKAQTAHFSNTLVRRVAIPKRMAPAIKSTLPIRIITRTKSGGCCCPVGDDPDSGTSLANTIAGMTFVTIARSTIPAKRPMMPSMPGIPALFDCTVYNAGKPMSKMSPPTAPIHASHTGGGPDGPNGPGTNTERAIEMAKIRLPTRSANPPQRKKVGDAMCFLLDGVDIRSWVERDLANRETTDSIVQYTSPGVELQSDPRPRYELAWCEKSQRAKGAPQLFAKNGVAPLPLNQQTCVRIKICVKRPILRPITLSRYNTQLLRGRLKICLEIC